MDPFRIEGPAIINVSGGRTSAYMLRRYLDANGGRLPDDVHAVFQNTGKELEETLAFVNRCAVEWGVNIRWIERCPTSTRGRDIRHVEVTYETASRNGEPFDAVILAHGFLPNAVMRFCTQDMKIAPARAFMLAQGYDEWTSAVGLRYDEPSRVHRLRDRDAGEWTVRCPLYDARVSKPDIGAFWRTQPFDLGLRSWESNCAGCMLRSAATLERVERDRPGTLAWWHEWEERIGATFHKGRRYLAIVQSAQRPMLPGLADDPDSGGSLPCNCTD